MANTGLMLSDDGKVFTAKNDSGTTAISAGDLLYAVTNNDVFGVTVSRANYAWDDILVKRIENLSTGYKMFVGVALGDAGTALSNASRVSVAMEGLFLHQVQANIEAGSAVQAAASGNKLNVLAVAGTTTVNENARNKIGRAITGGSADTKLILWKLGL